MIGVYPSMRVSASIVPEINHGKPVNRYDLINSINTHDTGRER